MVTIYSRSKALDLPHDKKKLSAAGEQVSSDFKLKNLHGRIAGEQVEPTGIFKVWAYPDSYSDVIDDVLLKIYKPKRKRIVRG